MTVIPIVVDGVESTMYIDDMLNFQIDSKVIPNIKKKDMDGVYVVDGEEGAGKSVLAMQLGKKFDPDISLDKICFSPKEFTKVIVNAKKGDCIIYDEAFTGLSSRGSLTEINRLLVELMMEMRQKNLFVIIVMPSFFLLDKYVALWRARGLFHVHTYKEQRGFWKFYNKTTKKLLYLKGKTIYDYSFPKCNLKGRFLNKYTVNEEEYRKKKREAMSDKKRATKAQQAMAQRDVLFYIMSVVLEKSNAEIARLCSQHGFKIDRTRISQIITEKQEEILRMSS